MVRLGRTILAISLIVSSVTCGAKSTNSPLKGVQGIAPASLAGVWEARSSFRSCHPTAIPIQRAWIDTFCVGGPKLTYTRFFGREVECGGEITETGASITCEGQLDFDYGCSEKLRLGIVGTFFEDSISLRLVLQTEISAVDESVCPDGIADNCKRIDYSYRRLGPVPESCGDPGPLSRETFEAEIRNLIGQALSATEAEPGIAVNGDSCWPH